MATDMNSPSAVAGQVSIKAPYPKRPFSSRELLFSIGSLIVIAIIVYVLLHLAINGLLRLGAHRKTQI